MTTTNLESFVHDGASKALDSAVAYLKAHDLTADCGELSESLRRHVKACLDGALADIRDAAECGMHAIGVATFAASMRLAGIAAAKECAKAR